MGRRYLSGVDDGDVHETRFLGRVDGTYTDVCRYGGVGVQD